jgi:hypothetical protein
MPETQRALTIHEKQVSAWDLLELEMVELCKSGDQNARLPIPGVCIREVKSLGQAAEAFIQSRLDTIADAFGLRTVAFHNLQSDNFAVGIKAPFHD